MEQQIKVHGSVPICGTTDDPTCYCIRSPGHWGPHVKTTNGETYFLVNEGPSPYRFQIAEPVALMAMKDPHWVWYEM